MTDKFPGDFGPIYAETMQGRFPVEPWNTCSNLIFLALIVRYAYLTRLSFREHPLLTASLPILLAGYIGGTVYHATRSANLWLLMDFIPIAILVVGTATVLWARVLQLHLALSVAIILIAMFLLRSLPWVFGFERSLAISLNYSLLGMLLLLPAVLHSKQHRWRDARLICWAAGVFLFAIGARLLDSDPRVQLIFPMGTHFLWHVCGGVSVGYLMEYIYRNLALVEKKAENTTAGLSTPVAEAGGAADHGTDPY